MKMLDLNIDAAVSVESACDETDPLPSSAVSDESYSSSAVPTHHHTTLQFSILNTGCNNLIQILDDHRDQILMTRQLLPGPKHDSFPTTATTARPQQWLKLSVPEAAALQQQQQQQAVVGQPHQHLQVGGGGGVKKSRRGPRSRSSQYRGVTFYRRTGRWESHIWFVSLNFTPY